MYFRIKNYYKEEVDFDRPVLNVKLEEHYSDDVKDDLAVVGYRQDDCAFERSKADESLKNKYDWHVVMTALNEKELDILLCGTFLELRQREIAEIFDTVQAVISRLNKKVNQKILELRLELA
jgi:DNA-directed RNA polymerase specialized sigma subunit